MANVEYISGLVSVVIPAYNNAQYIAECVESIENQTYPNIEIIIIDDGSTDNTGDVVKNLQGKYHNITYKKISNSKSPAARNEGILMTKGEFIALVDADDIWPPDKISKQMAELKKYPGAIVLGCAQIFRLIDGKKVLGKVITLPSAGVGKDYTHNVFRIGMDQMVLFNTLLTTTKIIREYGLWNPLFVTAHDWENWIRLSKQIQFVHLPDIFQLYRKHEESSTAMHKKYQALHYQLKVIDLHAEAGSVSAWRVLEYRRLRYESWIRVFIYSNDLASALKLFIAALPRSNMLFTVNGMVVFKEILVAVIKKSVKGFF